jgi:hypothetical protein
VVWVAYTGVFAIRLLLQLAPVGSCKALARLLRALRTLAAHSSIVVVYATGICGCHCMVGYA